MGAGSASAAVGGGPPSLDENPNDRVGGHPGGDAGPSVRRGLYGPARLDPARLSRDASRLAEEVVAHLYALDGTQVEVTIELTTTNPAGFPRDRSHHQGRRQGVFSSPTGRSRPWCLRRFQVWQGDIGGIRGSVACDEEGMQMRGRAAPPARQ